jgi:uncharacterized BrkB/YihY/UPF0761 family membrane protein
MTQSLKDWFKKPYDENAKNIVGNYIKNRLRVLFWMFIFVVILIVVLALDKQFNISKLLGIPCESIYSDERCNK